MFDFTFGRLLQEPREQKSQLYEVPAMTVLGVTAACAPFGCRTVLFECDCPKCGNVLIGANLKWPPMTPELLAWDEQKFNDEEMIAGVEEIRRTGGLKLEDFIQDLKRSWLPVSETLNEPVRQAPFNEPRLSP